MKDRPRADRHRRHGRLRTRAGEPVGLRIALLAQPRIPVPPPGYGGIEAVVALLAREVVRRGNEVTLFAAPSFEEVVTESVPGSQRRGPPLDRGATASPAPLQLAQGGGAAKAA